MRRFEGFQRGVNLGGWISQCVSRSKEHFGTFITKKDIEQIAGWGSTIYACRSTTTSL